MFKNMTTLMTSTTLYFQVDQKYVNNKTSASRTPKARQYFDFPAHVKFAPKANIFKKVDALQGCRRIIVAMTLGTLPPDRPFP